MSDKFFFKDWQEARKQEVEALVATRLKLMPLFP